MVLFLTDADVSLLVSLDDAVVSVRGAFAAQACGRADNAPRQRARLPSAFVNVMGGALVAPGQAEASAGGWMGAKVSVTVGGNRKQAWMLLFDGEGVLRCMLEANRLGRLRTGAATGVATDLLARPDGRVLACAGSGYQAWTQVEAVASVRPIERVHVWSRTPEHARGFAGRLRAELGLAARTYSEPSDAVREADVIVTITASPTPVLNGADVPPGAHVVLAGSNHPERREADAEVFRRAGAVYVDDIAQARAVSGDLRLAVEDRALDWADVRILDPGDRPDHRDGETTVFCSQGIGSWDVALASVAYKRALDRDVGAAIGLDGAPARGTVKP